MGIAYGVTTNFQATKGIVQDGLVLNLDAGVKTSYDGSDTTWTDIKNSNDMTFNNMTSANFSKANGGILSFDSTDEYITNSLVLGAANTSFSICAMVKITGGAGGNNAIFLTNYGVSGGTPYYAILQSPRANPTSIYSSVRSSTNVTVTTSSVSINNQDYNYVVLVRDHSNDQIITYANNSSASATFLGSYSITDGARGLTLGRHLTSYMEGYAGCLHAYNRALTAAEVSRNFNVMRHRFGI